MPLRPTAGALSTSPKKYTNSAFEVQSPTAPSNIGIDVDGVPEREIIQQNNDDFEGSGQYQKPQKMAILSPLKENPYDQTPNNHMGLLSSKTKAYSDMQNVRSTKNKVPAVPTLEHYTAIPPSLTAAPSQYRYEPRTSPTYKTYSYTVSPDSDATLKHAQIKTDGDIEIKYCPSVMDWTKDKFFFFSLFPVNFSL